MKSFMQMLLASFGVLALMLAGCNTDSTTPDDTDTDGDAVEEEDAAMDDSATVDTTVDADAESTEETTK